MFIKRHSSTSRPSLARMVLIDLSPRWLLPYTLPAVDWDRACRTGQVNRCERYTLPVGLPGLPSITLEVAYGVKVGVRPTP